MDRDDKIITCIFIVGIAVLIGYCGWLAATEQERQVEHRAKVCEIERQNNMKLDSFCISE